MERKVEIVWESGLENGHGRISTESGAVRELPYSFATRFGELKGTNPEELLGAAHAACFSMALTHQLEKAGFSPARIMVKESVALSKKADDWSIGPIGLEIIVDVPTLEQKQLEELAMEAKNNCPMTRALKTKVEILDISLAGKNWEMKAG